MMFFGWSFCGLLVSCMISGVVFWIVELNLSDGVLLGSVFLACGWFFVCLRLFS